MKRILLMVFRNLFFVPYGWFKLCWYASHAERYSEEQRYQLLKYVDNRAVKGGNLVIDGHGMENIPKENVRNICRDHLEKIEQGIRDFRF